METLLESDVEYGKGGSLSLKLDIAYPKEPSAQLRPGLVMVHGGGWYYGERSMLKCQEFAARGYVAATITYRLSGQAHFPAAVEDCKCAVRWMRAHAQKYGVDPNRIGAYGPSAGAHLVLMLGGADEKAGMEGNGGHEGYSSRVQAIYALYGPSDLSLEEPTTKLLDEVQERFIGAKLHENRDAYRKASPIRYVTKDYPPTLLVHGDKDDVVPYVHSEIMYEKLKSLGVETILVRAKNGLHGDLGNGGAVVTPGGREITTAAITPMIHDFFDKHLKNPG